MDVTLKYIADYVFRVSLSILTLHITDVDGGRHEAIHCAYYDRGVYSIHRLCSSNATLI